jgi:hypothetical protein
VKKANIQSMKSEGGKVAESLSALILVFVLSFVLLFMEMIEPKMFQFMRIYGHELFVVAVTMLGMGVGGLVCFLWRDKVEAGVRISLSLLPLSVLAAFFSIACGLNRYLVTIVCAAPYFFISLVISYTFIRFTSFRIYFANLLGSGLGVVAVYFALPEVGGEASLILCALIASVTALIYFAGRTYPAIYVLVSALFMVLSVAAFSTQLTSRRFDLIRLAPEIELSRSSPLVFASTAASLPGAEFLARRWNMISRIDVIHTPGYSLKDMLFPEGIKEIEQGGLRREIEDSFKTDVHMYSNNVYCSSLSPEPVLFTQSPPLPFLSKPRVLVIGVGGGMDIARARYHDPERLVGVEINPAVVNLLKGELSGESGRTYLESEIILLDGRTYIHFSDDVFDLINLVFADLYIPFYNSNIYLESYLYTEDAFLDYIDHLSHHGYLAITKMIGTIQSSTEVLRITSTLLAAAERAGIDEPEERIAVIGFRSGKAAELAGTVLFKKTPFTQEELAGLREFIRHPYQALYLPGEAAISNPFTELILSGDRDKFLREYPLDVSPTSDDQPFFYQFDRKMTIHKMTFVFFLILTSVLFFIPYLIIISGRTKRRNPAWWAGTVYFAVLAAGYMFLESVLVQRFNLYLGGGLYSLTLVVSCLLIFAGLGSMWGERISKRLGPWMVWIAPVLIIIYMPLLERVSELLPGADLPLRLFFAALILAPLCISLGLPFPWAIQKVKERTGDRSAALMFGLNATVGVLAVVASLWLSGSFGLSFLYSSALILYLAVGIIALAFHYAGFLRADNQPG